MSGRGIRIAAATLMLAAGSCGGDGELSIRSTPSPYAKGQQPAQHRVAEANGQFALGNVALALEGYRKALRDDPSSLDALAGLSACYDQMGRFDLSRRYYESALAIAPGDARLYARLAASLDLQGKREDAAAVRAEMAQRLAAAPVAMTNVPVAAQSEPVVTAVAIAPVATQLLTPSPPVAVASAPAPTAARAANQAASAPAQVAARSVTIKLPAPRPASQPAVRAAQAGPRLERLSLGEVALVTRPEPLWKAQLVEQTQRSATIGFRPLARPPMRVASVILLNAARSQGLAARTRTYLSQRGWSRIDIGDAPKVLGASTILYPAHRRGTAVTLANQFGFALRHQRSEKGTLTIMLGRDAAISATLRAKSG